MDELHRANEQTSTRNLGLLERNKKRDLVILFIYFMNKQLTEDTSSAFSKTYLMFLFISNSRLAKLTLNLFWSRKAVGVVGWGWGWGTVVSWAGDESLEGKCWDGVKDRAWVEAVQITGRKHQQIWKHDLNWLFLHLEKMTVLHARAYKLRTEVSSNSIHDQSAGLVGAAHGQSLGITGKARVPSAHVQINQFFPFHPDGHVLGC